MSVWDSLTGQQHVVPGLAAAASGAAPMAQSWLITGPAGSGRSVAALAFAAALECETRTGCGHCGPCGAVLDRMHADLVFVAPEGLSIGISVAKELVKQCATTPGVGRYRIVIVEDADRMTDEAENAFLKTLEEPPDRTVIMLCAPTAGDMLPTTASRCRHVQLRIPSSADLAAALIAEGVDAPMASFAARASQGHLGRARRLATDEQARSRRADVLRLPIRVGHLADALAAAADLYEAAAEEADASFAGRNTTELADLEATLSGSKAGGRGSAGSVKVRGAAGAVKDLQKQQKSRTTRGIRDVIDHALVDLTAWYRDLLALQVGALGVGGSIEAVHDDQRLAMEKLARGSRPEHTLARIEAILACRQSLIEYTGVSPQLAIEALAVKLQQVGRTPG